MALLDNDHAHGSTTAGDCHAAPDPHSFLSLRIASIFIIFIGSTAGALFPILAKRSSRLRVPKSVFDFAKYFGSGVIIATAFIHLLGDALVALSSSCLPEVFQDYPFALAFCLISIFAIFIIELVAFRWGTEKLAQLGVRHDAHGHHSTPHVAHGPEGSFNSTVLEPDAAKDDLEAPKEIPVDAVGIDNSALTRIVGVAILEFGVVLHSFLIGLTLAVDEKFKILFLVLFFHQTFEGLAIGARLAFMELPARFHYVPLVGAIAYGITTPLGIAIGLGLRVAYNPASPTASLVSGVLDSLSAGILLYTGLVELLAHEFLFNKEMMQSSNGQLTYAVCSMMLGCGLMALLGNWA